MGSTLAAGASRLRPFSEADVPQVARLHRLVFPHEGTVSPEPLAAFFREVFFGSPWRDPDIHSLVYESDDGRIIGFLGVFPRPMSLGGRQVRVAVSSNFMVEPESRHTLAGLELLERFLGGPQDISIAEGSGASRRLWEGLGGRTSRLYSLRWIRPLRPCSYLVSRLPEGNLVKRISHPVRPLLSPLDAIAARSPLNRFSRRVPGVTERELDVDTHARSLPGFADRKSLQPVYDRGTLTWLLDIFARKQTYGRLRRTGVWGDGDDLLGWYVYYSRPGAIGTVLQVVAREETAGCVLRCLFRDAWRRGCVALSGGAPPRLVRQLSQQYCVFGQRDSWMLIHARDRELVDAFDRGTAFFTRLEGEWMFFAPG